MNTPTTIRLPKRDATANPPAVLKSLFRALDSYRGPIGVDDLRREVLKVEMTPAQLGDAIMIDAGAYVRTLVRSTEHYEVLVMAWLPGQRSPIHDHAGSVCTVRIVGGKAHETVYQMRDDGLVAATGDKSYSPGQVVSSVDADIHALGNAIGWPASPNDILVTLHVYSPPLRPTRKYSEAGGAAAVA